MALNDSGQVLGRAVVGLWCAGAARRADRTTLPVCVTTARPAASSRQPALADGLLFSTEYGGVGPVRRNASVRNLLRKDVESYVCMRCSGADRAEQADKAEKLESELSHGQVSEADILLLVDDRDAPLGSVRVAPVGGGTVILTRLVQRADANLRRGEIRDLVRAAIVRAVEHGAREIITRPRADGLTAPYRAALEMEGFRCLGERVEYCAPLSELPGEVAGPFEWRSMAEVGIDFAASMLARVGEGDPHGLQPGENPLDALRGYLAEPGLTSSPDCVQIGYLGDRPVAFVCAQMSPTTGWSRISYMGVIPEARGQGLGRFVHLHGLSMLRAQGGKTYHDGTAADNIAMLSLFERHGCREHERMSEWRWAAGAGA